MMQSDIGSFSIKTRIIVIIIIIERVVAIFFRNTLRR